MAVSVAGLTTVVVSLMRCSPLSWAAVARFPTGACRLDQGLEQPTVPGLLGVPLHADHEPVAGQLDRLDDAVIRSWPSPPGRVPAWPMA